MLLGSENQHHPRKYATNHGDDVIFVFTCCSIHREFTSKSARDRVADTHNQEYASTNRVRPMK